MSDYYEILSEQLSEAEGRWLIRLREEADVYRGHFPGQPVSPGACNIEMLRCLASRVVGHECRYREITQCRFTHLITPQVENPLMVTIRMDNDKLQAAVTWQSTPCITLKAKIDKTKTERSCAHNRR